MDSIKEPVKLRSKKISNGNESLYLDIYVDGERTYEFLKLYLVPEKSRTEKTLNKETLALANSIKATRIMELQSARHGFKSPQSGKILFFEYFTAIRDKKTGTTYQSWEHTLKHLQIYEKDRQITFNRINRKWVEGFRRYLDREANIFDIDSRKYNCEKRSLGQGTKALYFQKLSACFNEAVRDGIIASSPMANVERFAEPESCREYLTLEELRLLASVDCDDPEIKRAFLFSCLTGLRWSDIAKLRWDEIEDLNGGTRIVFRQKKTRNLEYLDISPQAVTFLTPKGHDLVFPHLLSSTCTRGVIKTWVARAGIRKHITFHCARHTFQELNLLKVAS